MMLSICCFHVNLPVPSKVTPKSLADRRIWISVLDGEKDVDLLLLVKKTAIALEVIAYSKSPFFTPNQNIFEFFFQGK